MNEQQLDIMEMEIMQQEWYAQEPESYQSNYEDNE